jgi:hypothetical protein
MVVEYNTYAEGIIVGLKSNIYNANGPRIELIQGDCLEYMATLSDKYFELAIVDPPYGINFAKTKSGKGWVVRKSKDWDKSIPDIKYFDELFRVSRNQIVWGGNYMTTYLPPSMGWIFWDKGQRDFSLADGELACVSTPFLRQRLLDFSKFTTTLSDQVMCQMPPQRLAHYLI